MNQSENEIKNKIKNEIKKDCNAITSELENAIELFFSKDRIKNSDVIAFVDKIDSLKSELNKIKLCVVREYLN